jgi:hypothetical protein
MKAIHEGQGLEGHIPDRRAGLYPGCQAGLGSGTVPYTTRPIYYVVSTGKWNLRV